MIVSWFVENEKKEPLQEQNGQIGSRNQAGFAFPTCPRRPVGQRESQGEQVSQLGQVRQPQLTDLERN